MARWTFCWLLIIGVTTAAAFAGANAFVAARQPDMAYARLSLGAGLGSPQCGQAARALVAAGDGTAATATAEQQATYTRAAQTVLQVCS